MNLAQALRLCEPTCLAMVGAGGKTTALFQLARQLPLPVLVTASTHLAVEQTVLADHHHVLENRQDFNKFATLPLSGVNLVTGSADPQGKLSGLNRELIELVYQLVVSRHITLLIEADGSRQKPLKCPATHEPDIPPFVNDVVVVAGLQGLNKPLTPEWVHRSELFSSLTGLLPDQTITPEVLVRVLTSPEGGLKGIPETARRIVILNQADISELQVQARFMADRLLSSYHAVVIAALSPPLISIEGRGVLQVHEPVAAVILSAGGSKRLGQPKQLLPWRGESLIRHVTKTALEAELAQVIVVTGAHEKLVQQAVEDLPVKFAHNPDWASGQSSSVRTGLISLSSEIGAAIFLLADKPQVPVGLVKGLVELHARGLEAVIAPRVGGQRANPVLFDRQTFPELMKLSGDMGGRALFNRYPVTWLDWHDETLLLDIDTHEDYLRLLDFRG